MNLDGNQYCFNCVFTGRNGKKTVKDLSFLADGGAGIDEVYAGNRLLKAQMSILMVFCGPHLSLAFQFVCGPGQSGFPFVWVRLAAGGRVRPILEIIVLFAWNRNRNLPFAIFKPSALIWNVTNFQLGWLQMYIMRTLRMGTPSSWLSWYLHSDKYTDNYWFCEIA